MYMVVALLVWAVWITKKRIQNSEYRIQYSDFCRRRYEIPLVSFHTRGGISLLYIPGLFAAGVKIARRLRQAPIFIYPFNTIIMRKTLLLLLTMISMNNLLQAQTAEDSVKAAVNQLFEGMKTANAGLVTGAFADSAVLQTISYNKDGKTIIHNAAVSAFAGFVGKQKQGAADERIQFETIKIDGPLAIVWTPYKFYYNGQFSHCGVNSFQLVRFNGQWKIQYLIDTRRKDRCDN